MDAEKIKLIDSLVVYHKHEMEKIDTYFAQVEEQFRKWNLNLNIRIKSSVVDVSWCFLNKKIMATLIYSSASLFELPTQIKLHIYNEKMLEALIDKTIEILDKSTRS